jgi:transcriptional regulator with XRE-family HTH domain
VEPTRLGELLRRARERTGLSQAAAATAVGLNRVVLSYYESGQRQPALPVASALARLYGLSLVELLEEMEAKSERTELLFRAAPAELSDRARASMGQFSSVVGAYVDLVQDLSGELPGKGASPLPAARPAAGRRDAARLARDVRVHIGVGDGPIGDHLFEIADDVALVFRLPLGERDGISPSGFFYNHPRVGFCITVNSEVSLGRQVFTLAHELAHAFFTRRGRMCGSPSQEHRRRVSASPTCSRASCSSLRMRSRRWSMSSVPGRSWRTLSSRYISSDTSASATRRSLFGFVRRISSRRRSTRSFVRSHLAGWRWRSATK